MATLPAAAYFNNAARTEGEFKQAQEDFLAGVKQIPGAGAAELTATISSGSITPAGSGGVVVIDTEAAAATDDLTNIATTNYPDGSMLLIRNSNAARFVVCKHLAGGAGQFNLDRGGEYTLDDTKKWLLLQRRSADWYEVFRGPQRDLMVESPIINGSMEVWQRNTVFTGIAGTSSLYLADHWLYSGANASVMTVNRSTNVPTVAQAGVLFNYSLEVDITTADATIAAGDAGAISQVIEGYNWRHFAQRQFTLSFWVMGSKTGTHCVGLRNNAAGTPDRSYVGTYSISVANTWEYKTITVLPSPSAGTWNYTNGAGLMVSFILAAGSTFQTTAGAWNTGNFLATSAQVNELDNTANFFRVTGVRMELGPIATPYAFVDFETELGRCQRYYQKTFAYATAPATNIGVNTGEYIFPQHVGASSVFNAEGLALIRKMRTAPTITYYNPAAANNQVRNSNTSTDCTGTGSTQIGEYHFAITATTPAGSSQSETLRVHWTAEAEI